MSHVYLEVGAKKVFASSLDWPGWSRAGRSEEAALAALMDYVPRYRLIAGHVGLGFEPGDPVVVERVKGDSTTDFGAPAAVPLAHAEPVDAAQALRTCALVRAAWEVFDKVAAATPEELRKGPRGGGRDRDKIVSHVIEAERSYARKIGVRHKPFPHGDRAALAAMRDDIAEALAKPSGGEPMAPRGWPARYAAHRITWHVVDHLWEMEDRRT
ncbi:hypothetical protein Misp01_18200 [Microtetraspora sp. NBRC 13810]|uniref:hypothetical protein n=1 Tax=Microtetraspora sp. NBRC 13810 TaxID=3030990 RepID=UPI0024A0EBCE|nr:hypothetical protein [Microtetraspora sp. NBRC 13810]GLW06690.1 hypothetical protein Misp01_18200 [Microtetraspora sp. NBRC 13810]